MARPVRLQFGDALYHVTARGDRRGAIHADDVDRERLARLAQIMSRVAVDESGACAAVADSGSAPAAGGIARFKNGEPPSPLFVS